MTIFSIKFVNSDRFCLFQLRKHFGRRNFLIKSWTQLKESRQFYFPAMNLERNNQTRSMFRSVRYKVSRGSSIHSADQKSSMFRIKRNTCLESTLYQTVDSIPNRNTSILQNPTQRPIKVTYLQSFNSMMDKPERLSREKIAMEQSTFFEDARVFLPNFQQHQNQVQESEHSLLTPFNTPFSHVKGIFRKSNLQLKEQQRICEEIRIGLSKIEKEQINKLQGLKKEANEQFSNIRRILRKNQMQQQEKKLKEKRQLDSLAMSHRNNGEKFKQICERSTQMQQTIFNSAPYNLELRQGRKEGVYI